MATSSGADPRAPRLAIRIAAPAPASRAAFSACLRRVWAAHHGPPGATLELAVLGEEEHCRAHQRLAGDAAPTDVLAVAYRDPDLWGEILINADCARRAAAAHGHSAARECLLYAAHGALHLLGFDDRDPRAAAAMRAAELRAIGVAGGA